MSNIRDKYMRDMRNRTLKPMGYTPKPKDMEPMDKIPPFHREYDPKLPDGSGTGKYIAKLPSRSENSEVNRARVYAAKKKKKKKKTSK